MQRDIYEETTNRIVSALEAGTVPWNRPWRDGKASDGTLPFNAVSGRPYNGINVLILGTTPFGSLGWLTYKQAVSIGANVRKGEKGTLIVFWKFERRKDEKTGETKTVPFARGYTVFNVEQCDNVSPELLKIPAPPVPGEGGFLAIAEKHGANIKHGGNRAFFTPAGDFIQMPSAEDFLSPDHYQATLAHELTHWTGAEKRLNRQFGKRFGDQAYAFEELVAEIGSAFLCAGAGIALDSLQHPAYLANWLEVLKADKRAIFTAASKAKAASEYLTGDKAEEAPEAEAQAA